MSASTRVARERRRLQLNPVELIEKDHSGDQSSGETELVFDPHPLGAKTCGRSTQVGIVLVWCGALTVIAGAGCNTDARRPAASNDVRPTPVREATSIEARLTPAARSRDAAAVAAPTVTAFALPGATAPASLDYIAYDRARARVWVPVGDTGSVDAFDIEKRTFSRIDGFDKAQVEVRGKVRMLGPSAVSVGDSVVYVGDRATNKVCSVVPEAARLVSCLELPTHTDGVLYLPGVKEVWVTTPRDHSVTVLDASTPPTLRPKLVVKAPGETEGYALDAQQGLFYTNLEDENLTIAIDIRTHAIRSTWSAGCPPDGPRGIALDVVRRLAFVACTARVRVLDLSQGGKLAAVLDTGAGVDNIDYDGASRLLYVAAGKAARLTVAKIGDDCHAETVATIPTVDGARNVVVDQNGNAYVADPKGARLLVVSAVPR